MNITPEYIIEESKFLFLSENFNGAINLLRNCFDEKEVSIKTIVSLLKGEIGYSVNGGNVQLDKKLIDQKYTKEVNEVLKYSNFSI